MTAIVAVGVVPWMVARPSTQQAADGSQFGNTDWPFIGGDWANSRHSTLDQINRSNVATLGAAWSLPFDGGASTRATPVVQDGVLFIGSGTRLYARDAATGEEIWTVQPDQDASSELERAGIGDILNAGRGIPSPPGVALGGGKVFVGLMDGRVAAFSQDTGEFVWATQIGYDPPRKGQAVSGAPIYVDGKVFTGLANGDWAFRGKSRLMPTPARSSGTSGPFPDRASRGARRGRKRVATGTSGSRVAPGSGTWPTPTRSWVSSTT